MRCWELKMKKGAFSKPWGHGGWRSIVWSKVFCWDPVVWSPRRLDVVKCQLEETECFPPPPQKYNSSVPEKLTLDPMGKSKESSFPTIFQGWNMLNFGGGWRIIGHEIFQALPIRQLWTFLAPRHRQNTLPKGLKKGHHPKKPLYIHTRTYNNIDISYIYIYSTNLKISSIFFPNPMVFFQFPTLFVARDIWGMRIVVLMKTQQAPRISPGGAWCLEMMLVVGDLLRMEKIRMEKSFKVHLKKMIFVGRETDFVTLVSVFHLFFA